MTKRLAVCAAFWLCAASTDSFAQQMKVYRYNDRERSRVEVVPFGGYVWSFGKDFYYGASAGNLDFKDAAVYGVNLDIGVHSGSQVRLMYRREDTEASFRSLLVNYQTDASIEYWQIGGISGMSQGTAFPYLMLTLGGTRYLVQDDDIWKFSMIFGLGTKIYAKGNFGFQIQGSFPFTFVDGGGSISCGGGGCFTSIGGTGLGQLDVSGGIVIGL